MTLEEAKQEYPPGTVFNPAHLSYNGVDRQSSSYQITVPDNPEFYYYSDDNISIKFTSDNGLNSNWTPIVYGSSKGKANIISKPIVKSKDELLLEQADRDYPVGTTFYAAHSGIKEPRTECIREQNDKIIFRGSCITLSKDGIDHKTNSGGLYCILKDGKDWATIKQKTSKETLLQKAERIYPVGTTFNIAHSSTKYHCKRVEGETFHQSSNGDILISSGNDKKNGHTMSEVIYYKKDNKWAEIVSFESPLGKNSISTREEKFVLPEKWIITVTEENLPYVNAYRATKEEYNTLFKKKENGKYTYSYIDENGIGKQDSAIGDRKHITLQQFKQFLINKCILLPTEIYIPEPQISHSNNICSEIPIPDLEDFDSSPGANYSNNDDIIQTLYTPKKSRIPEVGLLQVKKRPII